MQRFQARLCLLLAALLPCLLLAPIKAGEKNKNDGAAPGVKRGPEHKVLQNLVGEYDAKVKLFLDPAKTTESKGVMLRTMILDGNFLQESFQGSFFGKPFTGLGVIGYDQAKKKFTLAWFDNMSTSTTLMHGTYDADKKTLTSVGEDYDQAGKKMKARDVLKIISADEQLFEMFRQPEGADREIKVMEISYRRRSEKK